MDMGDLNGEARRRGSKEAEGRANQSPIFAPQTTPRMRAGSGRQRARSTLLQVGADSASGVNGQEKNGRARLIQFYSSCKKTVFQFKCNYANI